MAYKQRSKQYLCELDNIAKIAMILFFIISFSLKIFTIIIVNSNLKTLRDPKFWQGLEMLDSDNTTSQENILTVFYWLNAGYRYFIYYYY